jgi:hypothetical protein
MTKLEVTQQQFDEIESIIRRNPGGPEWLETLTLMVDDSVYPVDGIIYVFFGPLANLLRWRRENQDIVNDKTTFSIVHATQHHKLQGARGRIKRIYDIDDNKSWYWGSYNHNSDMMRTLEEMYQLEARYGRAE